MQSLLMALREAVRQAVQTLNRLRDPDAHFLRQGARFDVLGDVALAYGYNPAKIIVAPPSPAEITRMETVLDWLGWLSRKEGKTSFLRIMQWANGVPIFVLAARENCSQRTIENRIDRSLNAILVEFGDGAESISQIEEPFEADTHALHFTLDIPADTSRAKGYGSPGTVPQNVKGKVYVSGLGFMRKGKVLRDGREKVGELRE